VDVRFSGGGAMQITDDWNSGTNNPPPDTASYATFGITRAASGSNLSYIGLTKSGTYPWGIGVAGGNSGLIFGAASGKTIPTPMMTLTTGGYLGIGNNTPGYTMDVSGTGRFTSDLAVNGNETLSGSLQVNGSVNINTNLTVGGVVYGLCSRVAYSFGGNQACPNANYNVMGFLGDGVPRMVGFLPSGVTTSAVGNYVVLGEDWGGTMICCRIN
jgi:hypothetical protein